MYINLTPGPPDQLQSSAALFMLSYKQKQGVLIVCDFFSDIVHGRYSKPIIVYIPLTAWCSIS